MSHSPEFARQWYEQMARAAGRWPDSQATKHYIGRIGERHEKGAQEYGATAWASKPFLEILREAAEEGVDIPSWLVFAAQILNREQSGGRIDNDPAFEIHQRLLKAAAYAMLAEGELREAETQYKTARAEAEWRRKALIPQPPVSVYED